MKKITLIVFTGILISTLISCTPDSIIKDTNDKQACCENEGTIELPPPPPPPEDVTGD
ncbi:hypothetical protein [Nonlabens ulvanivorans]|uniref:Lipoprotein n=1 Tax=Nonlabens ulvanivorans TaxID=906888 RepID=A0ABX5E6B6_NONUL|nr:hypothetical protein [Nonlabens ulvanivorans]PRX14120.1 hypothetical protein LY02_01149 [Nonlabens ulvanivorans]